jgi:hypothetical protein
VRQLVGTSPEPCSTFNEGLELSIGINNTGIPKSTQSQHDLYSISVFEEEGPTCTRVGIVKRLKTLCRNPSRLSPLVSNVQQPPHAYVSCTTTSTFLCQMYSNLHIPMSPVKQPPYSCVKCTATSTYLCHLYNNLHILVSNVQQPPYSCVKCTTTSIFLCQMYNNLHIPMSSVQQPPYSCVKCTTTSTYLCQSVQQPPHSNSAPKPCVSPGDAATQSPHVLKTLSIHWAARLAILLPPSQRISPSAPNPDLVSHSLMRCDGFTRSKCDPNPGS